MSEPTSQTKTGNQINNIGQEASIAHRIRLLMLDPTYDILKTKVSWKTWLYSYVSLLLHIVVWVEENFAKLLGVFVLFAWTVPFFVKIDSIGILKYRIHAAADIIAVLLLVFTLLKYVSSGKLRVQFRKIKKILTRSSSTNINSGLNDSQAELAEKRKIQEMEAGRENRRIEELRSLPVTVMPLSEVPEPKVERVLEELAAMAFDRWPKNASLKQRQHFFKELYHASGGYIKIAVELHEQEHSLAVVGYAAIVPMSYDNYYLHWTGQKNLFEQERSFFLDESELQERIDRYNEDDLDLIKDGLAVYVLGMNVIKGKKGSKTASMLVKSVIDMVQRIRTQCKSTQPWCYCATEWDNMEEFLKRYGFAESRYSDINGATFWASTIEPSTPDKASSEYENFEESSIHKWFR